jgi:hypothetical protein
LLALCAAMERVIPESVPGQVAALATVRALCSGCVAVRCRIEPYIESRGGSAALRRPPRSAPRSALGGTLARARRTAATGQDRFGLLAMVRSECACPSSRCRLSSSRPPRQWRPCGPSHAIGCADHGPGGHSQGFWQLRENRSRLEASVLFDKHRHGAEPARAVLGISRAAGAWPAHWFDKSRAPAIDAMCRGLVCLAAELPDPASGFRRPRRTGRGDVLCR